MGKISSYGTASAPSLGDKLIGTSVGGSPVNGTYNFTIQQLADLISGQITLQEVLTAGNTATQSINLTGAITATSLIVGNITSSGIVTAANAVINGYLKDKNASVGTSGQVLSSTVTGTQWITLPSTPTLQQVLNAGSTATHNISVTGYVYFEVSNEGLDNFKLYDPINGSNAIRYSGDGGFLVLQETNGPVLIGASSIGTSDKLQVVGNAYFTKAGGANISVVSTTSGSASLTLTSNTTGSKKAIINAPLSAGSLVLQTQSVDRVTIGNTGNVWIGTTFSLSGNASKLEVNGSAYFSNGIIIPSVNNSILFNNQADITYRYDPDFPADSQLTIFSQYGAAIRDVDSEISIRNGAITIQSMCCGVYVYGSVFMQNLPVGSGLTDELYVDSNGFVKRG